MHSSVAPLVTSSFACGEAQSYCWQIFPLRPSHLMEAGCVQETVEEGHMFLRLQRDSSRLNVG